MSTTNGSSSSSSDRLTSPFIPPLLISCASLIVGIALRWTLQTDLASTYCIDQPVTWWCEALGGLGLLIHFRFFGWLALGGALVSWWIGGRTLALAALGLAILGLLLYSTNLAALGFVAALLRSVRP